MATGCSNEDGDGVGYTDSCRLCLSKDGRQLAVFGPASEDIGPLSARIFACLSIDISLHDDLPKQICHRCECQINVWYYFKADCEVSQRKLTAWLEGKQSSSLEKETCLEGFSICQEPMNIKLEPEDVDSPSDQHINGMFVSGQLAETEEADSSHSYLCNNGVLEQELASNEADDGLNLVISGTTSVDLTVHEAFGVENDDPFTQITRSDNALSTKPKEICSDTEINKWPEADTSKEILQKELTAHFERSLSVKSESKESKTGAECDQPDISFNSALSRRSSRSLSPSNQVPSSTSTITPNKRRMRSLSPGTNMKRSRLSENTFKVPFTSAGLPKIDNDFYDETSRTCKKCERKFSNLNNLWRHIRNMHAKENFFKCGPCRKDFCGRKEFIVHRLGTINKYCRLGKKPEANASSFITINPKIKSGNYGKYECSECKLKFSVYATAQAHERIHTGEKPFICFKCGEREFRLRKTAVKHVAICKGKPELQLLSPQEDSKPIPDVVVTVPKKDISRFFKKGKKSYKASKCPKCGKGFANGIGLSNHLRTTCSKKCISCLKFIPYKDIFKHFRQCFKDSLGSSEAPENFSDNASNLNDNSNVVTKVENTEKTIPEESSAKSSPVLRKLRRFDMSFNEMWKKQHDGDGKLKSLTCVFCENSYKHRKALYSHILKHSSKRLKTHKESDSHEVRSDLCSVSSKQVSTLVNGRHLGKFSNFKRPKLKCDVCMKLFSSALSLEYHKATHKKVKCEKCELTFPASMERTHLCASKIKTEIKLEAVQLTEKEPSTSTLPEKRVIQYTCHLCKKKFHTRKMLYQHKKMHIKVKIYKCKMCNNSYSDAGALKAHKEEDHKGQLEDVLPDANKELVKNENDNLENQSSNQQGPEVFGGKPLYCDICHKGYSRRDILNRHMKLHESVSTVFAVQKPKDPGLFYCSICDKGFPTFPGFSRHRGWHSRSESSPKSEAPSAADRSPDLLKGKEPQIILNAIDAKGSEPLPAPPPPSFRCPLCPKKFAAQKNLKIHIHYHKIPKSQSPKETKNEHSEIVHKCEICFSTFPDLPAFSSHMETHTEKLSDALNAPPENESPKQEGLFCKLCNKEFKNKKNLNYHMMGHSGEKPYKCKSCSNQYSNPKALSKHEKERHSVVLHPFSCNRCKTSFLLREDLLGHQEKCPH